MRRTFLEAVAHDLISKYGNDLSDVTVVFPNKRASLFMNEYLASESSRPVWAPAYITISELFRSKTDLVVADPIKQVCDLYHSYISMTGRDETLDHFYGWGQLLLADFDDIDKNMADAHQIFANLKDIHELDDIDYLSAEQKATLKAFFSNFADDQLSRLKERFLSLWCHFEDIYHDFNRRLASQGLAYEGALYRHVIENSQTDYGTGRYVFIGFNMLQEVEQRLFALLQNRGKASYYWDFDQSYLQDNEAGHYISQYLARFPNALDTEDSGLYQNMVSHKDITYISAMTESAQAQYVCQWLKANDRIAAGAKTAIVLCDEALLQTVLHCLPEEVQTVNITTGYPLSQSPIASMVQMLLKLQNAGRVQGSDKFRASVVSKLLRHPFARYISERSTDLVAMIQSHNIYFPTSSILGIDAGLSLLFTPADKGSGDINLQVTRWMIEVIRLIGTHIRKEHDELAKEAVFRIYTILNRLAGLIEAGDLVVDKITFERLIGQLIQSTTVPFHGEPLQGIQIMGVLETRNLDFDYLLVLSATEGNMPKGVNDTSFIPYAIRKAYGLTTIDNKVAIYAYYFYRLMQRATDITLTYNKANEDGQAHEMSRFMLQLMVEGPHTISHYALTPQQQVKTAQPRLIDKTPDIMTRMDGIDRLSPTAINRYISCPLTFYYNVVKGLKEPDASEEDSMDNRMMGNIFHRSAELIYQRLATRDGLVSESDIDEALKHPEVIEMCIDRAFREELFQIKDDTQAPEYNGLQLISRGIIISYLKKLLKIDRELAPFHILGLERRVERPLSIPTANGTRTINIYGIIDRLDQITDADGIRRIRVIDYKTGLPARRKVDVISELFTGEGIREKHTNYYLQAILYAIIIGHDQQTNSLGLPVSPALLFIQQTGGKTGDPTLAIGKTPITRAADFEADFTTGLTGVLSEILDPAKPFIPTSHRERCTNCAYRHLCWG